MGKWVAECGRVEDRRVGVTEVMTKTELTQPQEGCHHQEMILKTLLFKKIRQNAFVFFSDCVDGSGSSEV
jgi:hypothetical protein